MIIEDMRLNIEFFENCVIKPSNDIRKEKTHEHPQPHGLQRPVFRTGRNYDSAASANGIVL